MFSGSSPTSRASRSTSRRSDPQLTSRRAPTPAPQSRNANSLLIEDTVNWLKGSHSISDRRVVHPVRHLGEELEPGAAHHLRRARQSDPANGMFNGDQLPGRVHRPDHNAARNLYAFPDRPRDRDHRLTPGSTRAGKYNYMGDGRSAAGCASTACFVQDSWRLKQNLTRERRRPLRHPAAVLGAEQQLHLRRHRPNLRHVGRGVGQLVQPVQAGQHARPARRSTTVHGGLEGVQRGLLNNFAPTVGLAWAPTRRVRASSAPLMGEGDFVVRGGYNARLQPPRAERLHRPLQREPGHHHRRDRSDGNNLPRRAAAAVPRHRAARRGAVPGHAGVSDAADVVSELDQQVRSRTSRCRTPTRGTAGIQRDRSARTWPSRCATSARAAATTGST